MIVLYADLVQQLGARLVNGLAVVGAAVLGAVGLDLLTRLLVRLSAHRATPPRVLQMMRVLGAGGLGLAVYLWVFGIGGSSWGLGGPGGWILGTGRGDGTESASTSPPPTQQSLLTPPEREEKPDPGLAQTPQGQTLQIEMLGGTRVQEGRFYVLDRGQPLTLAELRKAVTDRRAAHPVAGLEVVIYENSVARDHPAVLDLDTWARANDLPVTVTLSPRKMP